MVAAVASSRVSPSRRPTRAMRTSGLASMYILYASMPLRVSM